MLRPRIVFGYYLQCCAACGDFIRKLIAAQRGKDERLACVDADQDRDEGAVVAPMPLHTPVMSTTLQRLTLTLNGEVMQDESTADMIFSVARIIEFISAHAQLLPGDLVLTGSPAGNGTHYNRFIRDGDVLEGEITGLGRQRNACVAEPHAAGQDPPVRA